MEKMVRRNASGAITTYTHSNGSVGVMVEVICNSDFTARSEEFNELIHDIALQIAAMNPKFIRKSDVPANAEGDAPLEEDCLYEQPFIKDNSITVAQLIIGYEMKLKESVESDAVRSLQIWGSRDYSGDEGVWFPQRLKPLLQPDPNAALKRGSASGQSRARHS